LHTRQDARAIFARGGAPLPPPAYPRYGGRRCLHVDMRADMLLRMRFLLMPRRMIAQSSSYMRCCLCAHISFRNDHRYLSTDISWRSMRAVLQTVTPDVVDTAALIFPAHI